MILEIISTETGMTDQHMLNDLRRERIKLKKSIKNLKVDVRNKQHRIDNLKHAYKQSNECIHIESLHAFISDMGLKKTCSEWFKKRRSDNGRKMECKAN